MMMKSLTATVISMALLCGISAHAAFDVNKACDAQVNSVNSDESDALDLAYSVTSEFVSLANMKPADRVANIGIITKSFGFDKIGETVFNRNWDNVSDSTKKSFTDTISTVLMSQILSPIKAGKTDYNAGAQALSLKLIAANEKLNFKIFYVGKDKSGRMLVRVLMGADLFCSQEYKNSFKKHLSSSNPVDSVITFFLDKSSDGNWIVTDVDKGEAEESKETLKTLLNSKVHRADSELIMAVGAQTSAKTLEEKLQNVTKLYLKTLK